MRKSPLRLFRYFLEALLAYPLVLVAWVLPTALASLCGAAIGSALYYIHPGTAKARRHLQIALPERAAEHTDILKGMWRNLGRVLFEYAHLNRLWRSNRLSIEGKEIGLAHQHRPCVFVAAHLANWEVGPLMIAKHGVTMAAIYRPLNNPFIDPLLRYLRRPSGDMLFPKSAEGGMALMRHVRGGGHAGLLMDQRLGDGVTVPFFNQPVLAPPMAAVLAIKYNAVVLPVRVERLGGLRQRATIYPPLTAPAEGTEAERVTALTADIYKLFEDWIRARPEQWLWLHNRWRLK